MEQRRNASHPSVDFAGRRWNVIETGGARVYRAESDLRLTLLDNPGDRYQNAQIDDCSSLGPRAFLWRPPLTMTVVARTSHPAATPGHLHPLHLGGTAGFGFWNVPLTLGGGGVRLPDAVWFFYASPSSRMELVPGLPGYGWKAQCVHSHRWDALALGIPYVGAAAWARVTGRRTAAAHLIQRIAGAQEVPLHVSMDDWHTYTILYSVHAADFFVDGSPVLTVRNPPPGPLGFVAWIDNQYAVVAPEGRIRFGVEPTHAQWMELRSATIRGSVS